MNEQTKSFLIDANMSVKEVMKQMGRVGEKVLFVVNDRKQLLGSLSDGDIRRAVLSRGDLSATIEDIYNRNSIVLKQGYKIGDAKKLMLEKKIQGIPVVDNDGILQDVLFWEKVFGDIEQKIIRPINVPVVIMAGGKGARLDPFTKILPKPLIPIGDKSILEIIIDKFRKFGINKFYISTHYKAKLMKAYLEEIEKDYEVEFIEEEKPLGTAGGLRLIKNRIKDNVLVSNCDVIIDSDYQEIVSFHNHKGYDLTIVGSFRHFVIPYGVCDIENGGALLHITEKPEYDYIVNTGMYMLKKNVLKLIPRNTMFHITDLIEKVKEQGGSVGVFPIDEKSWIDVGQWDQYQQSVKELGAIQ